MKKLFLILAAAAAVVSCTKPAVDTPVDGSPKDSDQGWERKIAKAIVNYKFVTSQEMTEYFDFNIEWWDPVQKKNCSAKVVFKEGERSMLLQGYQPQLPCKISISLTTTLKEGKDIAALRTSEETINYIRPQVFGRIVYYDANDDYISHNGTWATIEPEDARPAKLSTIIKRYEEGGFNSSHSADIDENGDPSNYS